MKNFFKKDQSKDKKAASSSIDKVVEEKVEDKQPLGVEDNETAKQQTVLTSLTKKKNLSYGEILRARQGERKAKVIARRSQGDQAE